MEPAEVLKASWNEETPQVATEEHCKFSWNGGKDGKYFKCYLCGHKFKPGDQWRFIFGRGATGNILTCKNCDGDDIQERFKALREEFVSEKFWRFRLSVIGEE